MLLTKRGRLEVFDERGERVDVKLPAETSVAIPPHQQNFVEAIRTGQPVCADAMTGHLSSTLPHLGNLACRVGRCLQFDPTTESIIDDKGANQLLGRTYRDTHWSAPKPL